MKKTLKIEKINATRIVLDEKQGLAIVEIKSEKGLKDHYGIEIPQYSYYVEIDSNGMEYAYGVDEQETPEDLLRLYCVGYFDPVLHDLLDIEDFEIAIERQRVIAEEYNVRRHGNV